MPSCAMQFLSFPDTMRMRQTLYTRPNTEESPTSRTIPRLSHYPSPSTPTRVHTDRVIRPNRDAQTRLLIFRHSTPSQPTALRLAPLRPDDQPRRATIRILLLRELKLVPAVTARDRSPPDLRRLGWRRGHEDRRELGYFEG